jgi:hypothetical protein
VVCLVPCISPRTDCALGDIRSLPPVVLAQEDLDATPLALDGISVGPGVRINEVDAVVHIAMRVTLRTETVQSI